MNKPEAFTHIEAWRELVNKDDRTSPEEYPDMCLISYAELEDYMARAIDSAGPAAAPQAQERVCPICDSPAVGSNGYCDSHTDLAPDTSVSRPMQGDT